MPLLRNLRFLIEYGLLRAAAAVLRLLPLDAAVRMAGKLCRIIAPRTKLHRRAEGNIEHALPDLSASERQRILLKMWENTGRVVAEMLMLDRVCSDPKRIQIVRKAELEQLIRGAGPRIGITLHLGNWELSGWTCVECGARLAGIYRPLRNPYIDRYIYQSRLTYYPGGLLYKGKQPDRTPLGRPASSAVQLLRAGGHLGFAADQIDSAAPFSVQFFGQEAKFTVAPALFARRLDARMIIGRSVRIGEGSTFRFDFCEVPVRTTDQLDDDIRHLTQAMVDQFEQRSEERRVGKECRSRWSPYH